MAFAHVALALQVLSTAVAASAREQAPLFSFELPPAASALDEAGGVRSRRADRTISYHGRSDRAMPVVLASATANPWGGINAKDYGAVGDGTIDDAPALQRGIDAALEQGRTLLLPAGHYVVHSTLNVNSSARAHYAKPGPGFAKHPLRLVGEGELTVVSAGCKMHAVLNFSASSETGRGPTLPNPTERQFISDVGFNAPGLANYSVFAPGIARSRFERVRFTGALSVGLSIGYGWCNYIEFCYFGGNGVGLHTYNSANNIDVLDSIFEGNTGTGIYMSGGAQYNVAGNVLEGNGGPGIIVFGAEGVTISSNYYESNNDKSPTRWKNVLLKPALHNKTNSDILVHADVVLNGAPSFHDGTSDWEHWEPIDWSSLDTPAPLWYGSSYPPRAVVISGNTHAPHPNGSAVLLICGKGVVLTANEYGRRTPTGSITNNVALVETGTDAALFQTRNVFMKANIGRSSVSPTGEPANRGLLRLLSTTERYNGGVGLHTWAIEDPAPLYRPTNLLARQTWSVSSPSSCVLQQGRSADVTAPAGSEFNGAAISSIGHVHPQMECVVTFVDIDLDQMEQARGHALYLLVQAKVSLPDTRLALMMGDGSGTVKLSSDSNTHAVGRWHVYTYQMTMGVQGNAKIGLRVFTSNSSAATVEVVAELGHVVLAPVGEEWTRL